MSDITHDQAIAALQREYRTEIRSIASDVVRECYDPETREPRDLDECYEYLTQMIDGHAWVIYTWRARLVLVLTDYPDAYEDDLGERPGSVEQAAHMAMRADVREMLANAYFISGMFDAREAKQP